MEEARGAADYEASCRRAVLPRFAEDPGNILHSLPGALGSLQRVGGVIVSIVGVNPVEVKPGERLFRADRREE